MMKRNSLCIRLTVMTGAILLLCSAALTLSASYNARKQLVALVTSDAVAVGDTAAPDALTAAEAPDNPPVAGVITVAVAQRNFDMAGLIALAAISIVGTALAYFATRHTLRPSGS